MNLDLTDQERQLIECLRQQSHRLADRVAGGPQSNDFAILIRSDDGAWEINTRSGKLEGRGVGATFAAAWDGITGLRFDR